MPAMTPAERKAAQRERYRKAGNQEVLQWVPRDPAAKQELSEFVADLRRKYGTMLPEDFVWQ